MTLTELEVEATMRMKIPPSLALAICLLAFVAPASAQPWVSFDRMGTLYGYVGIASTSGALVSGSGIGDVVLRANGTNMLFTTNSGTSSAMTIGSDGSIGVNQAPLGSIGWLFSVGGAIRAEDPVLAIGAYSPGNYTIFAQNTANGAAIYGYSNSVTGYAIRGQNGAGKAGYFQGNVDIVGTLTKSSGSFKIDHPLDPANKYLYHSFVESPDMMNVYDGVIVLDGGGEAVVQLPEYFEALNEDFRYQLTCVGGYAPVYIADEVAGNHFRIAGGKAGLKVSWQVTGIRHDAYAKEHRMVVEELKPPGERGFYSHPRELMMDHKLGIGYIDAQKMPH